MMRLDKYLSHAGLGTRKDVKELIKRKRIRVNDKNDVKDKTQIDEFQDHVYLDDEEILFEKNSFIMLYKPAGVVCALSDTLHETVMDLFDEFIGTDMFPVGRLDLDTEGLLLICNDGKLSHRLLSPKHHVDKTYYVETAEVIKDSDLEVLKQGIDLGDFISKPAKAELITDHSCYLSIQEGKFHQVKRMFHAVDNEVTYLKRVRFGPLVLDEQLQPGEWRYLSEEEVRALYEPMEEHQ